MAPIIRQTDNADALPPYSGTREASPYPTPRTLVLDWRGLAVVCAFLLFGGLVGWWLVGDDIRAWVRWGSGGAVLWVAGGLGVLFAVRALLLVEQPGGYKVFVWQSRQINPGAFIDVQHAHASTSGRLLAQQTITYPQQAKVIEGTAQVVEPAALLPPAPVPVLSDTWLGWLDTQPHLLVAGRTGDGKTTLGNALLGRCISAGDEIAVIDPKWQPGKWRGCDPLAGSLDYGELYDALETIGAELDARYQEFNAGRPGETFPRLRVVIDEVPTIILGAIVGGKIINKRRFQQWLTFATKLGSIAREVNVNVWLFSQSPLIKDLYFSSAMRENFTRIALASQVRDLLAEESNKATKEALISLTRGQRFTAAMEYRSEYYVLDMADVPRIAQERVSAPRVWLPSARPVQAPVDYARPPAAKARDDGTVRVSVAAGAIVYPQGVTSTNGRIAWLLKSGYSYRQIERELGVSHQTISQVSKALQRNTGAHIRTPGA